MLSRGCFDYGGWHRVNGNRSCRGDRKDSNRDSRGGNRRGAPRSEPVAANGPHASIRKDGPSEFGVGAARTNLSLRMLIRQLLEAEQLTREDAAALDLFSQVRNRIVHGHDADDDEIARAIDSGTRLLRILLARRLLR
jgi:hypothetical protein